MGEQKEDDRKRNHSWEIHKGGGSFRLQELRMPKKVIEKDNLLVYMHIIYLIGSQ